MFSFRIWDALDDNPQPREQLSNENTKIHKKLLIFVDFGSLRRFIIIHIMFLYKYRILNCAVFVNNPPPLHRKIGIPNRDAFLFL